MKLDHLVHATRDFCCPRFFGALFFARHSGFMKRGNHKNIGGGGSKMMVPNNHWFSGFPTKNDHFGVFWGCHHFSWETSTNYIPKFCFMLTLKKLSPKKLGKHQLFFEKCPAFQMLQIQLVHCTNIAEMKYGNLVVFTSRIQRVVKRLKDVFWLFGGAWIYVKTLPLNWLYRFLVIRLDFLRCVKHQQNSIPRKCWDD